MRIKLPNEEFKPKVTLLSEIDIKSGYQNNEIYRACNDFTDYPDYPIYQGNFIIICFNGVLIIDEDSMIVIDSSSLSQENFNVAIELTEYSLLMEIK